MTTKKMPYYKITNEKENHYGLQYHDGINEDIIPFHPKGSCESGGMYYSRKDILAFLHYGPWIREVILLEDSLVYKDPCMNHEKWKTNKFFLKPRRLITPEVVQELINKGADVHASDDESLRWSAHNGHLEIVKVLLEAGADVHANEGAALRWSAYNGHLEIVKVLLEAGADVHASDDYSLRWASKNGHLETVKVLLEAGADVKNRNQI